MTGVITMDVTDAGVASIAPFVNWWFFITIKNKCIWYHATRLTITDGSIQYNSASGTGYDFGSSGSSASVANMFSASYTLAFATNNSERLRITSGGAVNIGGDYTETSYALSVNGKVELNVLPTPLVISVDLETDS